MIEIKNLTKRYGQFVALSDFNLTVPDGSILGLVGINGAGKSTFLRLLSGVYRADEGEILIDGENVFENERRKKDILFLPDEPYYESIMNGADLVNLYKTFYKFDNEIFKKYYSAFKLNLFTPIRSFSKGMKRQLFICLAFASSPKYLFLDEVFDGLDPAARLLFKRSLIELSERAGCTVIISSHSLRELEDICDSYAIIDGKKILRSGRISDSLNKVFKFQIAFSYPVKKEDLGFDCLTFESSGRIIKIVVKGNKEFFLDKIDLLEPLVVDETAVDFEEFFISELQAQAEKIEALKSKTESEAIVNSEVKAKSEPTTNPQTNVKTEIKVNPQADIKAETKTNPQANVKIASEINSQVSINPETKVKTKTNAKTKANPQTNTQAKNNAKTKANPQTNTQAKNKANTETKGEEK